MHRRIGLPFGMAAVVLCGALSVALGGCGDSSSGTTAGPGAKFLGRWELDGTSSTFTLSCQNRGVINNLPFWTEMLFEEGVLTDVSEVSPVCFQPGLSFDVDSTKNAVGLVTPDPYRTAPDNMPTCELSGGTDANGNQLFLVLNFDSASFTRLQQTAGQAPKGLWAANGSGSIIAIDTTGAASTDDTCTYIGSGDTFHQMTKL
jgi:hypothetical protein